MEWHRACAADEVPSGEAFRTTLDDEAVAVFNVDGRFFAIADTCSHEEASLSDGWCEDGVVECPKHGAEFSLETGEALSYPATEPVRTYKVDLRDGAVFVGLSDA